MYGQGHQNRWILHHDVSTPKGDDSQPLKVMILNP